MFKGSAKKKNEPRRQHFGQYWASVKWSMIFRVKSHRDLGDAMKKLPGRASAKPDITQPLRILSEDETSRNIINTPAGSAPSHHNPLWPTITLLPLRLFSST